jgi:hypothetical protein
MESSIGVAGFIQQEGRYPHAKGKRSDGNRHEKIDDNSGKCAWGHNQKRTIVETR